MPRTTADAVKEILLQDYDALREPSLTPFIAAAEMIVDRLGDYGVARATPASAGELAVIETWLAAWAYCQSDKPWSFKGTDGVQATFTGQWKMHLTNNNYGQTAVMLDPTGYLARLRDGTLGATAGVTWLGKDPANRLDYWTRYPGGA